MKEIRKQEASLNRSIWSEVLKEAKKILAEQAEMNDFIRSYVLDHQELDSSLAFILGEKLGDSHMTAKIINKFAKEAYSKTKLIY